MRPAVYLKKTVSKQKVLVSDARKYLKRLEPYDAIVGIGLSGALAIPLIAFALKKRFCIIRKYDRSTHSSQILEGNIRSNHRWIFVDDLIDSGRTFSSVCRKMKKHPKCVGVYLYQNNETITSRNHDIGRLDFDYGRMVVGPRVLHRIQKRLT